MPKSKKKSLLLSPHFVIALFCICLATQFILIILLGQLMRSKRSLYIKNLQLQTRVMLLENSVDRIQLESIDQ